MAPDFCAGAYAFGERQKPDLLEEEGMAKCVKGKQNAHFSKGQETNTHPCPREKARGVGHITPLHSLMPASAFKCRLSTTALSPYQACLP